ncbi:hypothetical protein SUGI_0908010 [Cryptomeria japonica]|nr:hypothetical protein SUGI_0908010 [Cryptomeria japonica]
MLSWIRESKASPMKLSPLLKELKTRLSLRYERSGEAGEILVMDFFVSTVGTLKEDSFRYCLYYSVHSSCGKSFLLCV